MPNPEDYNVFRANEKNNGKEMLEELNSDTPETDGFSKIDMRTRLSMTQIPAIMAVDFCVAMNALPKEAGKLTRSCKRLQVSLDGLGRGEMVSVIKHENEQLEKSSMLDGMRK